MNKDEMIRSITENYIAQTKKQCDKISAVFESCLRNAYNQGFTAGHREEIAERVRETKEAYSKGLQEGRNEIHGRVEQGKTDGYNEGLIDAWDTLRKILTVYPMKDMVAIFAPGSHGQEEDWRLVFSRGPRGAMNLLADYEAKKQREGVWLNTTGN